MLKARAIAPALLGLIVAPILTAGLIFPARASEAPPQFGPGPSDVLVQSPNSLGSSLDVPNAERQRSPFVISKPKPVPPFPILLNRLVQSYVDDYLESPETLEAGFERSRPFFLEMTETLRAQGVPEELVYLPFAESDFSKRGRGPWQFNKVTAQKYGLKIDSWVDERRDPVLSTKAAAEYLSDLHDAAVGDWRIAIVGWNTGDMGIDRYWLLRGENFDRFMGLLPSETRTLMGRFMAVAFIARNSAAYEFARIKDTAPQYHEIGVRGGTTLSEVAGSYHTTVAKLHDLNPAILRDRVPPYAHSYRIRVPLIRTAMAR